MNERAGSRPAIVALVFTIVAIWMLQHPYLGIDNNDSTLYSLLALARLHPLSLPSDVFLRFGSQDRYTLFSPLFAAAIRWFDLQPAAALLTFAAQVTFFAACWLFARTVMSARMALLAVALLVAMPSGYGATHLFNYVESFLTPRQWAEAATLAALALGVSRRYIAAGACLLLAMVLHPIMALAGIVMLACLFVAVPRPRLALILAGGAVLLSLVFVVIIPVGVLAPFDSTWLRLSLSGAPYLLLQQWELEDWARLALPVALLGLGATTSNTPRVRELCLAALATMACGLALNGLYGDLLHSVIFIQLQPWRWLWLLEVVATLLLPLIAADCWRSSAATRAALLLLAAAWVSRDSTIDPYVAALSIGLAGFAFAIARVRSPPVAQRVRFAASLILALALLINLAFKFQYDPMSAAETPHKALLGSKGLAVWAGDGVLLVAVVLAGWRLAGQGRTGARVLGVSAAVACIALAPLAWQSWTDFQYSPGFRAAVARWRAIVPQQAQVIWPVTPMGTWYLLERPSYYSIHQVAGDLFSREKAVEIHRRGELIASILNTTAPRQNPTGGELPRASSVEPAPFAGSADGLNERGLEMLCADSELDFYVSWARLDLPAVDVITPDPLWPRHQLHLYRCADVRKRNG